MSELISRETAIELIHSLYPSAPIMRMNRKRWKKKYEPYIEAEKALEMLPSVEPEGKWIHDKPNGFKCSKCNKYLDIGCGNMKMNFCPNCGANMREGEDG